MYVVSILALIIFSIVPMLLSMGGSLEYIVDAPSILILLLIFVPMLVSAGVLKDFNNAFRLGVKADAKADVYEMKRAINAVSFAIKALWTAGIFATIYSAIYSLILQKEMAALTSYLAVGLIPLLYSSFLVMLLLPLRARLTMKLEIMEASAAQSTGQPDTAPSVSCQEMPKQTEIN